MEPDRDVGAWKVWAHIRAAARAEDSGLALRHAAIACSRALSAVGAGVSIERDSGEPSEPILATSSPAEDLEELQYTLGEGPCRDGADALGPVLVTDLAGLVAGQRWPVFAPAATHKGVRGMFVFPLRLAAVRLGVLSVYRSEAGPLDAAQLADALVYADAAVVLALEPDGATDIREAVDTAFTHRRARLHQAAGMVAADAGVDVADALALIRSHAYAADLDLREVAADVISGQLYLRPEGDASGPA